MDTAHSINTYYYPIGDTNHVIGSVLLSYSGASGSVTSTGGWSRNAIDPTYQVLQQVATVDQVRSGSYEARILRVPALRGTGPYYEFLWLKSENGGSDLFSALGIAKRMMQNPIYTTEQFIQEYFRLEGQPAPGAALPSSS